MPLRLAHLLFVILGACLMSSAALPSWDLLKVPWGKAVAHEGAVGGVDTSGKYAKLTKTAPGGYLLWAVDNDADIPLLPGKRYEVTADMTLDGAVSATLMISMPTGDRRPFPTDTLKKSGTASIVFTARDDETLLRPHIVLRDTGKVTVKAIRLQQLEDANPRQLSFDADAIRSSWQMVNPIVRHYDKPGIACLAGRDTRFESGPLQWDAASIPALELDLSCHPEGGSIILAFHGILDGKTYSAVHRRTFIPSGKIRTVMFDFARQLQWRGTITGLSIRAELDMESDMQLTGVRACSEPNLIPNAANPGRKVIELIRPSADYVLKWQGKKPGAVTLVMRDADDTPVQTVAINDACPSRTFTTPDNTVSAIASTTAGTGYPLLVCKQLPSTNVPDIYWKSSWMWNTPVHEPYDTVTFLREFTLPEAPKRAEIRYIADDKGVYDINGNTFQDNGIWHHAERRDITDMLKKGRNAIKVDVTNVTGGGGLLFELYAELQDGTVFTLGGDKHWRYIYKKDSGPVVLLGVPPKATSWSDRIDCCYIGPRYQATFRNLTQSSFQVRPERQLPDFRQFDITIRSDTGAERVVPVAVTPRMSQWTSGSWTSVSFSLNPDMATGLPGRAFSLIFKPDYIDCAATPQCPFDRPAPASLNFPKVRIASAGKRPWFEIDGKRLPPFYFDLPMNFINAPLAKAHFVANAAKAGSSVFRIWYSLRDFWTAPDQYDFDRLDFAFAVIRSHLPDARIIVNCQTYMPEWWLEKHPDSRIKWFKHDQRFVGYHQSLGSLQFLQDAPVGLTALVNHLRDSGNGPNTIGVIVTDGGTNEWMWQNEPYGSKYWAIHSGNSASDHQAFAQFLKDKYGDDAPDLALPFCDTWYEHGEGIFLDPRKQRDVIEFFDFRNLAVSRDIRTFAKAIKDASGRHLLSGAYYGYLIMFSRRFDQFQASGHLRLNEVASSGDCDLFFAPTMYGWRFPGEADELMQPAEAITAHGALPIAEFDYRTYTEPAPAQMMNGGADTVATTISLLDKGFGMALVRAAGGHWMELHERWFREPLIIRHIASLLDFYKHLPPLPSGTTPKDLCVVSDERSAIRTANNKGDGAHRAIIAEICRTLSWSGAAYDHVLLEDFLEHGRIKPHRFYIFTNLLELSDDKRAAIRKRLNDENAHALWMYAPGVAKPGEPLAPKGIRDMTGITVRREDAAVTLNWESVPAYGGKTRLAHLTTLPNFLPESGYDTVVATSGGIPVAVSKRNGARIDYFSAALVPQEDALRRMLRQAGVHIYQKGMDVLYAGNDFIVLHAITDGSKQLVLPPGTRARQFMGRKVAFKPDAPAWKARAAETFGFIIEK